MMATGMRITVKNMIQPTMIGGPHGEVEVEGAGGGLADEGAPVLVEAQMTSGPTKLSQPAEMTAAMMAARWPRIAQVRSSLVAVRAWPDGLGIGCVMTPSSRRPGAVRCWGRP